MQLLPAEQHRVEHRMKPPNLSKSLIIAEDAKLAAQVSCKLAARGSYLPVLAGPRLSRPDAETEVVRCNNAVARSGAQSIYMVGLSKAAHSHLGNYLPIRRTTYISEGSSLTGLGGETAHDSSTSHPLTWGRDNLGIGLLKALRERRMIEFATGPSPVKLSKVEQGT